MTQRRPRNRDPAYLARARDWAACEACRTPTDGTLVAAHLRQNDAWGAQGIGVKPDDAFTLVLCGRCHRDLDEGSARDRYRVVMSALRGLCLARYKQERDDERYSRDPGY